MLVFEGVTIISCQFRDEVRFLFFSFLLFTIILPFEDADVMYHWLER